MKHNSFKRLFLILITKSVFASPQIIRRYFNVYSLGPRPVANAVHPMQRFCLPGRNCLLFPSEVEPNYSYTFMLQGQRSPLVQNETPTRENIPALIKTKKYVSRSGGIWRRFHEIDTPRSAAIRSVENEVDSETSAAEPKKESLLKIFMRSLDEFDRKFYMASFTKLSAISPEERRENGISFVQSGVLLYLVLTALSFEVDPQCKDEIDTALQLSISDEEKIQIIKQVVSLLPNSSQGLKFRWANRLAVNGSWSFRSEAASILGLRLDSIDGDAAPENITAELNRMVEEDSAGIMRSTFAEDETAHGIRAALVSTLYMRARWRASPTMLNGTFAFHDHDKSLETHMIRVNDIMRYADLKDWDAEALEIYYATPHLSMLLVIPRKPSLRSLASLVAKSKLHDITEQMRAMRIAAKLPIYTLRMTLLLPNKLEEIGVSRLLDLPGGNWSASDGSLRISHAMQRLMFWAEAGRNAFKDDGIDWDPAPELELTVDRPYIFFVRWKNITIVNGNFVL